MNLPTFSYDRPLMCFDVESVGLHGEGFAVAWVVLNEYGEICEEQCLACPSDEAQGTDADRAWIAQNVPALPITHARPAQVRAAFWQAWLQWRERGAQLVADCAWPVEAGFLSACVRDMGEAAHWFGPYPLYDISSMHAALGVVAPARSPVELPLHHPLVDARYLARCLLALPELS